MKKLIFILTIITFLFAQYDWSDPVMLAPKVTFPDAAYGQTAITVDKTGIIHAFWVKIYDRFNANYEQIMYRSSNDGGVSWSNTSNLTPDYFDKGHIIGSLNIVCDSENNLHLMFLRGTEGSKVMYMKYDGLSWTTPVNIYDYAINYLRVAIDGNDRIYAVWWNDPSYFAYLEHGTWSTPESISETYLPSIKDIIIDKDNNVLACGLKDVGYYVPFYCKYDKINEEWTDFEQIEGFDERSIACALTLSKNDTLNINISVGPTWSENINYNLKRKTGDSTWTTPRYVNDNTDMLNKDYYRDNDDNLHLFERSTDDSSLVYTVHTNDIWTETVIQYEPDHNFWMQSVYFDDEDQFYTTYIKIYYETNERAIFFQKKLIEVGIE
ncbi:MAG: exo-alpha-sialidase, partial [Candidatus Delongbacteria bacterium]|nr:exo-alpha-sialidase [Candidatus Delongbacteria bacterium]